MGHVDVAGVPVARFAAQTRVRVALEASDASVDLARSECEIALRASFVPPGATLPADALAREIDPGLTEGVYAQLPGPHYETPAEIRMIRTIGGDLVGMSTTLEAIAARQAGLEVLGMSLVTNAAAGMTGEPLNHEEVLEAGRSAATRMGELLSAVLPRV